MPLAERMALKEGRGHILGHVVQEKSERSSQGEQEPIAKAWSPGLRW